VLTAATEVPEHIIVGGRGEVPGDERVLDAYGTARDVDPAADRRAVLRAGSAEGLVAGDERIRQAHRTARDIEAAPQAVPAGIALSADRLVADHGAGADGQRGGALVIDGAAPSAPPGAAGTGRPADGLVIQQEAERRGETVRLSRRPDVADGAA